MPTRHSHTAVFQITLWALQPSTSPSFYPSLHLSCHLFLHRFFYLSSYLFIPDCILLFSLSTPLSLSLSIHSSLSSLPIISTSLYFTLSSIHHLSVHPSDHPSFISLSISLCNPIPFICFKILLPPFFFLSNSHPCISLSIPSSCFSLFTIVLYTQCCAAH